jgi:hypothetical protein
MTRFSKQRKGDTAKFMDWVEGLRILTVRDILGMQPAAWTLGLQVISRQLAVDNQAELIEE